MVDDQRKKKRGRSKLFKSCFKSSNAKEGVVSDDRSIQNGRIEKPVLIAVTARKGNDFIPDVNLVNVGTDAGDCYVKRRHPHRRVSRILKAVWFDSMMKKKKKKKIRRSSSKSSMASDTSSSSSSEKNVKIYNNESNAYSTECTDMEDSCSRRSHLLSSSSRATSSYSTSSSSSSSVNSNSRWSSDQKQSSSQTDSVDYNKPSSISSNSSILKKPNHPHINLQKQSSKTTDSLNLKRQDSSISLPLARPKSTNSISKSSSYPKGLSGLDSNTNTNTNNNTSLSSSTSPNPDWNLRWCLFILLSFVVLVFWGRIFSILCTSIWFYFVPSRRVNRVNSVANSTDFQDLDSVQYKKRVIMAGFLDRTRNPIR